MRDRTKTAETMTKIRLLGNRVLLQLTKEPEPDPGTLILPDSLKGKERHLEVVEIGEKVTTIKIQDRVMVDKYAGQEITHEDEKYILVKEEEITAVLHEGQRFGDCGSIKMYRVLEVSEAIYTFLKEKNIDLEEFCYVAGKMVDWHKTTKKPMIFDLSENK